MALFHQRINLSEASQEPPSDLIHQREEEVKVLEKPLRQSSRHH